MLSSIFSPSSMCANEVPYGKANKAHSRLFRVANKTELQPLNLTFLKVLNWAGLHLLQTFMYARAFSYYFAESALQHMVEIGKIVNDEVNVVAGAFVAFKHSWGSSEKLSPLKVVEIHFLIYFPFVFLLGMLIFNRKIVYERTVSSGLLGSFFVN